MTKTLLVLILMGVLVLVFNFILGSFSLTAGYSLPLSILLGVTVGFFLYTLIDNRIG